MSSRDREREGSNGNGNSPLEMPLWASEQYIDHQKARVDLIQWGEHSHIDFVAGGTNSETWQGNISSFWTDDGVKRNVIRRSLQYVRHGEVRWSHSYHD